MIKDNTSQFHDNSSQFNNPCYVNQCLHALDPYFDIMAIS